MAYATIRNPEYLGLLIGETLVEIVQHDEEEFAETGQSVIECWFASGMGVRFYIGDEGFDILNHPESAGHPDDPDEGPLVGSDDIEDPEDEA